MKKCNVCEMEKELSSFHKDKSKKDGYRSQCKECVSKKHKLRYEENKEEIKERIKKYRENNTEYYCEYNKRYREENKEELQVKKSKYYFDNKEIISEKTKEYYLKNKDILNERNKKSYEKRKNDFNNKAYGLFNKCKIITYIFVSDNHYKIGYTMNLYNRYTALKQVFNINSVYILNKNIEKRLLKELSKYNYDININFKGKSECFKLPQEIFEFIIERENFKELKIEG